MGFSILKITDGTISVDLIHPSGQYGFKLLSWNPAIAGDKDGGVWRNSPLGDGRQLVMRRRSNVIEAFVLSISGHTQEDIIAETRKLRKLLEQAKDYWLPRSSVDPVWIEARADCETNSRYAYIYDGNAFSDENPYGTAFASVQPNMQDWTLGIERGQWQDTEPGASLTCVEASNTTNGYKYSANLVLNPNFETAGGGGADVFANWTESSGDGAIARDTVEFFTGVASAKLTAGASMNTQIYQDITVTAGARYAFSIRFMGYGFRYRIANLTAGGDVIPLTEVNSSIDTEWRKFSLPVDIPTGCVSIRLFLRCFPFSTFAVNLDQVFFGRITSITFGRSVTCENEVFVSNKFQMAQLTDIYTYDASATTYSSNLIDAALPFNLLPNPVAVGDMVYFGIEDYAMESGPFTNIVFDISQAAVGLMNGEWEYWNGTSWTAMSVGSYDDTTFIYSGGYDCQFGNTGVCFIAFQPDSSWEMTNVVGYGGYYIRYRVTRILSGTPIPQQQNRRIYTATQPYIDIDSTQIPGDIQALIKTDLYASIFAGAPATRLIVSTRKAERGLNFIPYINFTDIQNPAGIVLNLDLCLQDSPIAPTGRSNLHPITMIGGTSGVTVDIFSPLCDDYAGVYRAFVRIRQTAGAANTMNVRLNTTTDRMITSEIVTISSGAGGYIEAIDLGKVVIPPGPFESIRFTVLFTLLSGGGTTEEFFDLILIPVDEYVAEVTFGNWPGVVSSGSYTSDTVHIEIDSTDPKEMIATDGIRDSTSFIIPNLNINAVAGQSLMLNSGKDSRLYVFNLTPLSTIGAPDQPANYWVSYPKIYRVARYLSMRGDS